MELLFIYIYTEWHKSIEKCQTDVLNQASDAINWYKLWFISRNIPKTPQFVNDNAVFCHGITAKCWRLKTTGTALYTWLSWFDSLGLLCLFGNIKSIVGSVSKATNTTVPSSKAISNFGSAADAYCGIVNQGGSSPAGDFYGLVTAEVMVCFFGHEKMEEYVGQLLRIKLYPAFCIFNEGHQHSN